MMPRHNCGIPEWPVCCVCGGRMHEMGCTSVPRWDRDCCTARHQKLAELGYAVGIWDSGVDMRTGNTLPPNSPLRQYKNPTESLPVEFRWEKPTQR